MLKIKDNVDLEELRMFGFKNSNGNTWYKSVENDDYDNFETNVIINPYGNFEENEIIFEIADLDNSEEKCGFDVGARLDILYDLIQAGLVEKVEDS